MGKKDKKMQHKFIHLMLVLAKRRVAINWMGLRSPQLNKRETDVVEWSVAEEIRLIKCRRDTKLEEDLECWRALMSRFAESEDSGSSASTSDAGSDAGTENF